MSVLSQSTILSKISLTGIGIHTGKKVNLNILPSSPNSGIIFKRTDLKKNNIVIPNFENVSEATLCTTISNEYGVKVSTIEHLMAAFLGLGIDNAIVEVDSQEIPILDGSAKDFVKILIKTGLKYSDVPIKLIKINNHIEVEDGNKYISFDKSNTTLEIEFEINYKNQFIKNQKNKVNVFEDKLDDIYNSRTFCLYEDIEMLKKLGLGKGGSLENAIVVKNNNILNGGGLRNKHEFVNHKILDCMGDLYLVGYRIIGSLVCRQGGHSLTNKLLRKVFSDNRNYSLLEIKGKSLPHSLINNRHNLKSIA
ncbi:UDP-3-O-[3-hydroxymyristoyl] N-acetylglucosamine deacetylase [Pelagibacterales bacterium SAG-MED23]|nr:UDP-3-O-[3-hydroxymyristoyl] N-acetylglucosamine deacetylase [Pelagibacterales bacterium SAG-MED23]